MKEAGLVVFHVVPTLLAALKAVAAGVDGLIVEEEKEEDSKTQTQRVFNGFVSQVPKVDAKTPLQQADSSMGNDGSGLCSRG